MSKPVRVRSAPGLVWVKNKDSYTARWQARTDLIARGFVPKSVKLWVGTGDPSLAQWDEIADACNSLQREMLVWARGGLPGVQESFDGSLESLMRAYKSDPDSPYRRLRYASRKHYDALMDLIRRQYATRQIADIKARTLITWHKDWSAEGKVAVAHAKIGMLRTLFSFGTTMLEDDDCAKLSLALSKMRFAMPKPRTERLTADQATAIRGKARELGRPSIALAQAIQFEGMLRQKDILGEWVPLSEPGASDVLFIDNDEGVREKWLRGIRWSEIDSNLVLKHVTSKRQKEVSINLRFSPMVLDELKIQFGFDPAVHDRSKLPASGPVIVSEWSGIPWTATEFRRWWRKVADECKIPKTVRNMDSRAGAISEATDAGAELEHIRHAATHSDISMTQRYSRGSESKIENVQRARLEYRNRSATKAPKT